MEWELADWRTQKAGARCKDPAKPASRRRKPRPDAEFAFAMPARVRTEVHNPRWQRRCGPSPFGPWIARLALLTPA
jgi:hypothetical protein